MDEQKPQSKTASATIGVLITLMAGGGVLGVNEIGDLKDQVVAVEVERDTAIELKRNATEAYVYAMISSGRKPTLDAVSLDDLQQAYVDVVGGVTLEDSDLFIKGENIAKERGDFICQ